MFLETALGNEKLRMTPRSQYCSVILDPCWRMPSIKEFELIGVNCISTIRGLLQFAAKLIHDVAVAGDKCISALYYVLVVIEKVHILVRFES